MAGSILPQNNKVNRMTFMIGPTKTNTILDRFVDADSKRYDDVETDAPNDRVDPANVNVDKTFPNYQVFSNQD